MPTRHAHERQLEAIPLPDPMVDACVMEWMLTSVARYRTQSPPWIRFGYISRRGAVRFKRKSGFHIEQEVLFRDGRRADRASRRAEPFARDVRWPAQLRVQAAVHKDRLALTAILILSAFVNLFQLTSEGYGNTYYAAAVKNMLTSWRNFFFVTFDAGFVSVDKPPLGFWIQAASAKVFGFQGWSIILPQALAACSRSLWSTTSCAERWVRRRLDSRAYAGADSHQRRDQSSQQPRGFTGPGDPPGDLGVRARRRNSACSVGSFWARF